MSEPILTQAEADALIQVEKHADDTKAVEYPAPGGKLCVQLHSSDHRERFYLDLTRGRIALLKVNHNLRVRTSIPLVRLDINGAPHTNPDGSKVGRSHVHLYREGFGDSWAFDVDPAVFKDVGDPQQAFSDFISFCRIQTFPPVDLSLF